jgi:hypothetical protein
MMNHQSNPHAGRSTPPVRYDIDQLHHLHGASVRENDKCETVKHPNEGNGPATDENRAGKRPTHKCAETVKITPKSELNVK